MREKTDQAIFKEIGLRIRTAREESGYTQERFAELIEVSPQFESALERGIYGVSIAKLMRICDVLSVSSDRILMGRGEPYDVSFITERLKYLPPQKLETAEKLLMVYIDSVVHEES